MKSGKFERIGYTVLGVAMTLGVCVISFADDQASDPAAPETAAELGGPAPAPPQTPFPASSTGGNELQAELMSVAPAVSPYVIASPTPMEWETKSHPERKFWSEYAFSVVNEFFPALDSATDMKLFCPNYETLDHDQKVMAWTGIFVGTARWESSWDPTERTFEDQGTDVITGQPVYSEGLLQLSYQDVTTNDTNDYCPFDWAKDKLLSINDVHRTIMNPYINLWCGIRTMADLVTQNKQIVVAKGGYWSTLSPGGFIHTKVKSIDAEVRNTMPFCGSHLHGRPLQEALTRWFNWKINRDLVNTKRKLLEKLEKPKPAPSSVPSQAPAQAQDQTPEQDNESH